MNNWHQITAGKTMSKLTNTTPYISGSDSYVHLFSEKCENVVFVGSVMASTSHKPNYKLGHGSPTCRSDNLKAGIYIVSLSLPD